VWRIISEWRWLILGSVAVALAAAIILTLLTRPLYRASTVLELNPPAVEAFEDSKGRTNSGNDSNFLATQYGLLRSRTLAARVAQELNLASNQDFLDSEADRATRQKIAAGILAGNFSVDPSPGSRLVTISYSSPSPELAARITNGFADSFINTNLERRYEATSYARQFLQSQIRKVKRELERSERILTAYAQQQGIVSTAKEAAMLGGDASSLTGETMIALNQALSDIEARRIASEQAYRQFRNKDNTAEVAQSTSGYRNQQAQLEAEYQSKLMTFKPDFPEMVRLRSRIDSLDAMIAQEAGTVASSRTVSALAEYQAMAGAEQKLNARVAQLKTQVLGMRNRNIRYNILQREVDTNRSLYDALLQRYKEIGVAGGIGTNQVSVVDRADVPGAPYSPNLPMNLAIGLALGLIGGVGGALGIEFVNDVIKTPDDVRDKLRLTPLGTIPRKVGDASLSEELKDHTSPISEAYFSLRTALQFSTDTGAPTTLLVTSTRAAEGKSSTTLALAQNFASLGYKVLLIDADLRKPAFVTGAEPTTGLSKLLTNQDPISSHALKTYQDNLWLVPCGPLPPNPAELLASPRLKALFAEGASQYDMVIVDGPPVLGLADAPLLGAVCRATLMVVESGKTRTRAAADAVGRLQSSGSHILGVVLTKYRSRAAEYGYDYEPYRYGGENELENREREIRLIANHEA
jgi:capsular exopolysaccharide synthesis family protein